jgi:hypothetical protein
MRGLKLSWGLWNAVLSGALLWDAPAQFPEINWMGMCFVALNGVLGLSLMIHTFIEFEKNPSEPQKKVPPPSYRASISSSAKNATVPKVEGV